MLVDFLVGNFYVEPSLASLDETKQLRCDSNCCEHESIYWKVIDEFGRVKHCLKFTQHQATTITDNTELMTIARLLKGAFRYHLGYDIDAFIISETRVDG